MSTCVSKVLTSCMVSVEWMGIHSTYDDEKAWLYTSSQHRQRCCSCSLSRECCHGPGCSRSRRVTGSYGRSAGIEDLVNTSREHGRSAVSMETMDSYGFTCKGALSPYARRTRHSHEEDQARRAGAAMRRTKLRWLPLRGSRDRSRHRS